jgi:hypothetical protein
LRAKPHKHPIQPFEDRLDEEQLGKVADLFQTIQCQPYLRECARTLHQTPVGEVSMEPAGGAIASQAGCKLLVGSACNVDRLDGFPAGHRPAEVNAAPAQRARAVEAHGEPGLRRTFTRHSKFCGLLGHL